MGVKASAMKYGFDGDAAVTLRDIADGAETHATGATVIETAVSLNELDAAYWQDNEIPNGLMAVAVHITQCLAANADETYSLQLIVDDVVTVNDTPSILATLAIPRGTTGVFYMYVDSRTIEGIDTESSGTDKWMAVQVVLGGTDATITYGAWIAKSLR